MDKMKDVLGSSLYVYEDGRQSDAHSYLLPTIFRILDTAGEKKSNRIFDLGCGDGSVAAALASRGFEVHGIDPSEQGIAIANRRHPTLNLRQGSAYDDLATAFGKFPIVISLEVVEHIYAPRKYISTLRSLLDDDGYAIISTPYHGYWKNLTLALMGKMDSHFTALWDHGHIKFWSFKTLRALLEEAGFRQIRFYRVGRFPLIAKSMIAVARNSK